MVLADLTPAIEFDSVSVSFGPIKALREVSFSIGPGEIVGLLGHNGAGKSSVVNVATGAVPLSDGAITVSGTAVPKPLTPRLAALMGVGVVHQEPALAPNLSVFDNMFLGRDPAGNRATRASQVKRALSEVQLDVALGAQVGGLSLGERQLLDIARSILGAELNVLFLDEPTAALGKFETDKLHNIIRKLSASGTAIVYVSHRLRDIEEICQRFLVLRDGEKVTDQPIANLTPQLLARTLSAAGDQEDELPKREAPRVPGAPILTSTRGMQFAEGEIVGLFGMAAGEQFSFLASVFGVSPPEGLLLDGKPFAPRSPRDAIKQRVFMVQADRENESLLANLSARENVLLPWQSGHIGLLGIDSGKMGKIYVEARRIFGVHGPSGSAPIGSFSGGNRQKHVLARWLVPEVPRLLLLAQPTQGVDEGSKADIRRVLRRYAEEGVTVLIASAESDEIARVCGRAYVLEQNVVHEVNAGPKFEERLMEALLSNPKSSGRYSYSS